MAPFTPANNTPTPSRYYATFNANQPPTVTAALKIPTVRREPAAEPDAPNPARGP